MKRNASSFYTFSKTANHHWKDYNNDPQILTNLSSKYDVLICSRSEHALNTAKTMTLAKKTGHTPNFEKKQWKIMIVKARLRCHADKTDTALYYSHNFKTIRPSTLKFFWNVPWEVRIIREQNHKNPLCPFLKMAICLKH